MVAVQLHHLAGLDWLVVAMYAVGLLGVGWYYSRRTVTADDYLLGGRRMRPSAVGLSLFATLISTLTYLALPGEMIKNGPLILCQLASYPFIVLIVGWLLIPFIMRLRVTSAYELLELRLGPGVRTLGSLFFLSLRLLWMAVIIYTASSTVLVPLSGLDAGMVPLVCLLLGGVTVVYTSMGGLRAVVVTDVVQTLVLFGGALVTLILITVRLGGVSAWWPHEWAPHWQQPSWFDPTARVSLLGAFVAPLAWYVCTNGSDQMAVQRYLSTRDAPAARRVITVSMAADALVNILLAVLGFALLAFFQAHPELAGGADAIRSKADQLFPRFIVLGLPAGISGLVVSGLLAAAMSSLSSGMSAASSVIKVDLIDRFRRTPPGEQDNVRQARCISVALGAVVVGLSLFASLVPGNLFELAHRVVNLLVAPLFLLFVMAFFVPWATPPGAFAAAFSGLATAAAIAYWEMFTGRPGVSFLWIMPGALVAGTVVGALASLLPIGRRGAPLTELAAGAEEAPGP